MRMVAQMTSPEVGRTFLKNQKKDDEESDGTKKNVKYPGVW